ncbi:Imm44 family immunity protein [Neisseria dumasiana]|uniref:Immunity protein 63 domain-containing protein n=1 Tax=Neisseria dumasiana TaxID=1931275 RepID=A0ABX3WJM3_9NEIS|nr:Imm44 family immunity protein [Neisseria dumasiana]OSI14514.1 hypothetical protein BV914_09915 [Neisseria dumasiana]OSI33138.1 hypothetical protein BV913_09005 [Neisseria dumasiana]UOO83574.1 immunity 44 family protein [Neisseria dumasiana]
MKFWASQESDFTVAEHISIIRKLVEPLLNQQISGVKLNNSQYEEWEWAFIAICLGPSSPREEEYKEIIRRSLKNKTLEFRLYIKYEDFLNADFEKQLNLYCQALHRCLDVPEMDKWKFAKEDRELLHNILNQVEKQILEGRNSV